MSRIYGTKEGSVIYSASNQKRLELNRNYHIQKYSCKLSVTHTNSSASFKDEDLLALINSIQIVANGDETIKSVPASKFHISSIMANGRKGLQSIDSTDGSGKESYVWFDIYFAIPKVWRPEDTIFNTAVYSTLNMLVNWGSDSSIGSGITVTSATLDVYSDALVNYSRNAGEKIKHFKEVYLNKNITVSSTDLTIEVPVKHLYKSFEIVSLVDGVRNGDIINKVTVKSGTTVIAQLEAEAIKAKNYVAYEVLNSADLTGIYIIDFLSRGKMSDLLDTITKYNTLELVFDVTKQTGTNDLNIYSDIIDIKEVVEVKAN
jgi:hypothetical protein